jgi:hypothetical protein
MSTPFLQGLRNTSGLEQRVFFLLLLLLVSCGGVRLTSLGTSATIWPIAPDDG